MAKGITGRSKVRDSLASEGEREFATAMVSLEDAIPFPGVAGIVAYRMAEIPKIGLHEVKPMEDVRVEKTDRPPVLIKDFAAMNYIRERDLPKRALTPDDFKRMRIPNEFWKVQIQKCDEWTQYDAGRYLKYLDAHYKGDDNRVVSLYLFGDPGVGKTALACLFAKGARLSGRTVLFVNVFELREAARTRWVFEEDQTLVERAKEVDLLILDTLTAKDIADPHYGERFFEDIITYRKERERITIITSRISEIAVKMDYRQLGTTITNNMCFLEIVGKNRNLENNEANGRAIFGR